MVKKMTLPMYDTFLLRINKKFQVLGSRTHPGVKNFNRKRFFCLKVHPGYSNFGLLMSKNWSLLYIYVIYLL